MSTPRQLNFLICCVDNPLTRRALASSQLENALRSLSYKDVSQLLWLLLLSSHLRIAKPNRIAFYFIYGFGFFAVSIRFPVRNFYVSSENYMGHVDQLLLISDSHFSQKDGRPKHYTSGLLPTLPSLFSPNVVLSQI